ncbi:MAG: DUF1698 domain-containing protein [Thermodesulfovibrionales bacterium]|nr:DUF1698 domain-containing protein [Thermodesulfovibrionales bacterium]
MFYPWKVKFLKTRPGNLLWRYWRAWRGDTIGDYKFMPKYIRQYAMNSSFADIGCMWGVNGEYAFIAEKFGATSVRAVDVFGPTPEFEVKRKSLNSAVEFILGDITQPETIAAVGIVDVVFCAGVLYHHPSPFDLLVALRRICGSTLILRTFTIPENSRIANTAVYFPMLKPKDRGFWNLSSLGVSHQAGISDSFNPYQGYGNWFWGISPSCLKSLLQTAGFKIEFCATEAFAQTVICTPMARPFFHRLPNENNASEIGEAM